MEFLMLAKHSAATDAADEMAYLGSFGEAPRVVHEGWLFSREVRTRSCARGCGSLRAAYYGEEVTVIVTSAPKETITHCLMVSIVKRELYEAIAPHLGCHVVGKVVRVSTANVLDDWVTVYCPTSQGLHILERSPATYKPCRTCGAPLADNVDYYGSPSYVYRPHLRGRHAHIEGTHGGLLVTPWLARKLELDRWPDLEVDPVPICDEPKGEIPWLGLGPSDEEVATWSPGEFRWKYDSNKHRIPKR